MTQRTPTAWSPNPSKVDSLTAYSSSLVTYNSSVTAYSNPDAALDDFGKIAEPWSPVAKTPAQWSFNPTSELNDYLFDSASHTYDSAVDTYDGIVAGNQDHKDQKTPTTWSPL